MKLSLDRITSSVTSSVSSTFSKGLSGLADEAVDKAKSVLGDLNPFKKLGAKSSEFDLLAGATSGALKLGNLSGAKDLAGKFGLGNGAKLGEESISNLKKKAEGQNNLTAGAAKQIEPEFLQTRDHFVSLADDEGLIVEFKSMPEIQEQRQVQYEAVAPPQMPGAFQKYKQTDSTTWQVNATLVSRTSLEATENLRLINILRGWTMPYFGHDITRWTPQKLGAPPPVLTFKGYSVTVVGPVPAVITSLNWTWPKDVDWLPAVIPYSADDIVARSPDPLSRQIEVNDQVNAGVNVAPFPAVIQVTISLVESYSTTQFNNFNLQAYRAGDMIGAFLPLPAALMDNADTIEEAQVLARSGQMPLLQTAALQNNARLRGESLARTQGVIDSARQTAAGGVPSISLTSGMSELKKEPLRLGGNVSTTSSPPVAPPPVANPPGTSTLPGTTIPGDGGSVAPVVVPPVTGTSSQQTTQLTQQISQAEDALAKLRTQIADTTTKRNNATGQVRDHYDQVLAALKAKEQQLLATITHLGKQYDAARASQGDEGE